jgi:hypothetical protein
MDRAVSSLEEAVHIDDRHNLAAVDEDAGQPRRTAPDRLQADAGHDLVNAANVQGQTMAANLKRKH